jgi:hypothetical protein
MGGRGFLGNAGEGGGLRAYVLMGGSLAAVDRALTPPSYSQSILLVSTQLLQAH